MITHPKILYLVSAPFVAADGSPLNVLDMKSERDVLVRELSSCKRACFLRIGSSTVDELTRGVEEGFNILFVSCHGHQESLLFEDGKGGSQPVSGDYLKKLIGAGRSFKLAFVSACHSEKIGALLVEAGIPHVVAVKSDVPVLDQAAIVFVGQFFRSLFRGESVQKAFDMAKLRVEGSSELWKIRTHLDFVAYKKKGQILPEEKKFVLLPSDVTHSDFLLSEIPEGLLAIEENPPSPSNLPVKPRSFMGRSQEMHAVINELFLNRMVSVTGAGGIGKTTLAIEVARWICAHSWFPDGVFYTDLRQVDTADGIIALLGATFEVEISELEDMIAYLKERRMLLLLDNAEDILWHHEEEMHNIINSILKFTYCTLLVTSQRPVGNNLYEPERCYRLSPLEKEDAALLLLATAKRKISWREWESQSFHDILRQVGGHPLSIVLTACQIAPGITLEEVLERIEVYKAKAITIKNITDKDLTHGESLAASLASAHHVLSDGGKTLLEILSLLPAGAQNDILEGIYGDTAWEYVRELNEASLVEIRNKRVTLLPPVRLYALSILTDDVKEWYGSRIMEVLGEYTRELYARHTRKNAREHRFMFSVDEPNLRLSVELPCKSFQIQKESSILGLFGAELIYLYIFHNRWKEAEEVGNRILVNLKKFEDLLGEAHTYIALGVLWFRTGNIEKAQNHYERALKIYEDINVRKGEANALWTLGDLFFRTGNIEKAQNHYEKALKIYKEGGVHLGEANAFLRLGVLWFRTGNIEKAQVNYEKALKIYEEINVKIGEANTLRLLGDLALWTGNHKKAQELYEKALRIYQYDGVKDGEARALVHLAQWAAITGAWDHAHITLSKAFTIYRDTEDLEGQAHAYLVKAILSLGHGDIITAQRSLESCSFIEDKICAHAEAAQWLIFYANLFSDFTEGAHICLHYAKKFASKAHHQPHEDVVT
ncbi:MAG: tetratricopeptide repeat protein [Theionarchaea archaeon]|nr:tetratricopeptide repeat protein [Theionarchaea archaeon]